MTSFFRPFALCAVATAGLAFVPAHASLVTLTTTGTISYGYDNTGEFGTANTQLDGRAVSITYSFDSSSFGNGYQYNYGNAGTQTVVVNGVSREYALDPNSGYFYSYFINNLSKYGQVYQSYYDYYWGYSYSYPTNYDQIYMDMGGYGAGNSSYVSSNVQLYSYDHAFGLPEGADAKWTYTPVAGDNAYSYFQKYDTSSDYYWNTQVSFSTNITSLSLNNDAKSVPEPTSALLTGIALLGAFGATRKARARRAG